MQSGEVSETEPEVGVGLTQRAMKEAALLFFLVDEVDAIDILVLFYGDGHDD